MRSFMSILMLLSILPMYGCADDPAESSEIGANPTAAEAASEQVKSETDSDVAYSDGDGPRLCSSPTWEDSTYLCISLTNEGLTFADLAPALAKKVDMSEEEFLSLNEWDEQYLAYPIEPGVKYLYRVTQEAYVKFNTE